MQLISNYTSYCLQCFGTDQGFGCALFNSEEYILNCLQYECFVCDKKAVESFTFKKHLATDQLKSSAHKCEQCHQTFANEITLKCHIDSSHNRNDVSQQAGKLYQSIVSYERNVVENFSQNRILVHFICMHYMSPVENINVACVMQNLPVKIS